MSAITLVTIEGYTSRADHGGGPSIAAGTEQYIDTGIRVSDERDILAVIRRDFDVEPDGSRRSNPSLDPVVRYERINDLLGKLLTLVDASTTDAAQRKAQKDLFKQTVWGWYEAQTAGLSPSALVGKAS